MIFEALGAASMCWCPIPLYQVFDDTRAAAIGDALCTKLATSFAEETSALRAELELLRAAYKDQQVRFDADRRAHLEYKRDIQERDLG